MASEHRPQRTVKRASSAERKAAAALNPTAASLLGFLHLGDLTGYQVMQLAEMIIGDFWSLTRSQVYRELAGLAESGLIEAGEIGTRSQRPYRLTKQGRRAFAVWVDQPPGPEQIRYPLLLTISFGSLLGRDRIIELVQSQRSDHEQRLADYIAKQNTLGDPFLETTLAFGIHYERAVLAWMDEVPTLL